MSYIVHPSVKKIRIIQDLSSVTLLCVMLHAPLHPAKFMSCSMLTTWTFFLKQIVQFNTMMKILRESRNGSPFLKWTLVGILKSLMGDLTRWGSPTLLLLSCTCILHFCNNLHRFFILHSLIFTSYLPSSA